MSMPNGIESRPSRCTSWQYSGRPPSPRRKAMTVGCDVPRNHHHIDLPRQDFKEFTLRELWRIILRENKEARSSTHSRLNKMVVGLLLLSSYWLNTRTKETVWMGICIELNRYTSVFSDASKLRQIIFTPTDVLILNTEWSFNGYIYKIYWLCLVKKQRSQGKR
jgi:hypothetical protein